MNSNYFLKAREDANQNFMSADGFQDADGDFADFRSFSAQEQLNADGGGMVAKESQPYIVTIVVGSVDKTNVELLDACLRQSAATLAGVTFGYGLPNITYPQFLAQLATGQAFEVGKVRIIASNSSTSTAQMQVTETITISTKGLNGNKTEMSIPPVIDNYQYSSTQVDINTPFMVDGLTSFVIATCYASTTIKLMFFPSKKTNAFQALSNGQNVTAYKAPNVNPIMKR